MVFDALVKKLLTLSIRTQFMLLVVFLGLPALALVVQSGHDRYRRDVQSTFDGAQILADRVAIDLELQVRSAQQLMQALSLLPSVRMRDADETHKILKKFVDKNPIYANILITDRSGQVWTAAASTFSASTTMADRRAFKDAVATGHFSAGEYVIGKLTQKPIMNFAFPIVGEDGAISDVIMFGINLSQTSSILRTMDFPAETNFLILDHQGIFLFRGSEFSEKYFGKADRSDLFARTTGASAETGTFEAHTNDGLLRLVAFRKLRLYEGDPPYAYVRAGIPYAAAMQSSRSSLARNLAVLGSLLFLTLGLAWVLSRYLVINRVNALQTAAQQMADGNLQVRMADRIKGGELGALARSFDHMANALEKDRHARSVSEEALRQSESRFRDIVMNSGDWVWEVDSQGRFNFIAGRVEEILGYRAAELLGKTPFELMPAEEGERTEGLFRTLSAQRAPIKDLENYNLHKDGRKICLLTNAVPFIDEQGRLIGYRGVDKDITARKDEECKLRHALCQAETANRVKSEFLANMSHEIRTPLNGTLGMLQVLEQTPLDNDQQHLVAQASRCGWSLLQLLNDILDLARIEAAAMAIQEQETDVAAVVDEVLNTLRLEAEAKGITLEKSVAPAAARLNVDTVRLRQVLFNLIGNAVKFTPQGQIKVEVGAPLLLPDRRGKIEIVVSDTGIGIAGDKIPQLGQPFTQVEGANNRQFQGAGLGLSIVKRLVELMNGTFIIESRVGQGTLVRLTLEVGIPETEGVVCEESDSHVLLPLEPLRILVVEDNPVNLRALQGLLERDRHQVVIASDGEQAVTAFQSGTFDLILMDMQMPVMDGIAATRQIRALPGGKDIPVIAITAHAMSGDRELFLSQGLTAYLTKPFSKAELNVLLRRHVRGGA